MKLKHKVNFGWERPSEEITDRYQREIDESLRKARKAWRKAQKSAERAERIASQRPSPETFAARDDARRAVLARLDELREVEELMRAGTGKSPSAVHRTGRQERLEVGEYRKPRKKKNRNSPVTTRRNS